MTRYNVTAPEAGYAGVVGRVQFHDSQAVIDEDIHPGELAYCRSAGYRVEDAVEAQEPEQVSEDGEFDPAKHDMPTVLAYLTDADEAEAIRVLDAEAAAPKPRKGIVDQRDAILDSKKENVQ